MTEENIALLIQVIPIEFWNTIYMVVVSLFFATLLGLPMAIVLYMTKNTKLYPRPLLYMTLSWIIGIGRSFPFAILMVALIPLSRLLIGTSLGTNASIVSLSIAASFFIARLFEQSFDLIDHKTIEASLLMGASPLKIIPHILLREALPSLILAKTTTAVTLIGYSAMVGAIGGGGLGKIAIQYGYLRFNTTLLLTTVFLLILLVQFVQYIGHLLSSKILIKRGLSSP